MLNGPDLPTLYHEELSVYSQAVRLILVEKGVAFQEKLISTSPPCYGNYLPDYVRLNPNCTVPTMVVGDRVFTDSKNLVLKTDKLFDGPKLLGTNVITTGTWIVRFYTLDQRQMACSTGLNNIAGKRFNRIRIDLLQKYTVENPDLADIYAAKLADIEELDEALRTPYQMSKTRKSFEAAMDTLDKILQKIPYIAGTQYSIADSVWTVVVARMMMLGQNPCPTRPHLKNWFGQMKARPSYKAANIVDHLSLLSWAKLTISLWR